MDEPLVQLALIVVVGVGAQWVGSRLKLPSILFLLTAGILVGPVFGYLRSPIALMFVIAAFTISDLISPDPGLVAATLMGVALANQRSVPVRHIAEFKENLQVLLIGILFILLAGRLDIGSITNLGWPVLAFVAISILIARPLSVLASTIGSPATRNERVFISWLSPRGIVAASVASVFSFELVDAGYEDAAVLVPVVFVVIISTVIFYGLTAGPVARRLGLAETQPQGVLLVGAHDFGRQLARAPQNLGFRATLIDTNYRLVTASRLEGLEAYQGNAISEEVLEELEFSGNGRSLAMTSNDEVNSLAALLFPDVFGRAQVYQLPPKSLPAQKATTSDNLRGRTLFGPTTTYEVLDALIQQGWRIKATHLTPQFDFNAYRDHYANRPIPLAIANGPERLQIVTGEEAVAPGVDQTLIALVLPEGSQNDPR